MNVKKIMLAILLCLSVIFIFSACENTDGEDKKDPTGDPANAKKGGTFIIELYPEYAPETVANFVKLVGEGFYEGLTFHRISSGFMAQGGGYGVDEYKFSENDSKPTDSITGEFASNGFTQNTLKHTKGVISMARTPNPNSAGSEFFIMYGSSPHLDGDYAAFGKVIEGMDVIDKLTSIKLKTGFAVDGDKATIPVSPVIIKKAVLLATKDGENPKVQMEIEY